MSSTKCKLFPDSFKTHGTIGTDVFKPWFLVYEKISWNKNLTWKSEGNFYYMFPRSPQERVGGVGSVLLFRRELPTLKLDFSLPFSLPWNNGYLRVRVVSSFHYRRFARVVKCLTLPLFKNGILVHSPAVPWKSASVPTAFHVRLFVFPKLRFSLVNFWSEDQIHFKEVSLRDVWRLICICICIYIYIWFI